MKRLTGWMGWMVALLVLAVSVAVHVESDGPQRANTQIGDAEICAGSFELKMSNGDVVGFVWERAGSNGTRLETYLLFRPGASDGWVFPGVDDTSVDVTFQYIDNTAHEDLAAFMMWAAERMPPSAGCDPNEDFEVHEHVVTIY